MRDGINIHLYVHADSPDAFSQGTEAFPDKDKYNAVPAIFDADGQASNASLESLLGQGATFATPTRSGLANGFAQQLAFRAQTVARATDRLKNDVWAQRAAALVIAVFVMRRLGF